MPDGQPDTATPYSPGSAAALGLANCSGCHKLTPIEKKRCSRCGTKLRLRSRNSVQTTLALVATAMVCYIPANSYPIMNTMLLGDGHGSTIIGGVTGFVADGSYFIALVIFIASVAIPIAKMAAIVWLCFTVQSSKQQDRHELTRLYRVVEFIGKWSMIDVFVVALLAALVQLSGLMEIQPGIAISAFSAVVVLTMIAAQQFDTRLIWDKAETL